MRGCKSNDGRVRAKCISNRVLRRAQTNGRVRIDDLPARLIGPLHRARGLFLISAVAHKTLPCPFGLSIGQLHLFRAFKPAHLLSQSHPIAPTAIEQQPLKIRTHLNVHRRRDRGCDARCRVIAIAQSPIENVVHIGRHHQCLNRQPHLRCDIACEDISEIARRDAESNFAIGRAQLQRGVKIIHHLRHQPRPIDRVYRANVEAAGERLIAKHALHHCLRIVKAALNRNIVDIGRAHRSHLAALNIADLPLGMEHEDIDPLEPCNALYRG